MCSKSIQTLIYPMKKNKPINKILDNYPAIPESMLPLITWMKEEYHCLTIEAVRCVIPPGLRSNVRKKTLRIVYLNDVGNLEESINSIEKDPHTWLIFLDY